MSASRNVGLVGLVSGNYRTRGGRSRGSASPLTVSDGVAPGSVAAAAGPGQLPFSSAAARGRRPARRRAGGWLCRSRAGAFGFEWAGYVLTARRKGEALDHHHVVAHEGGEQVGKQVVEEEAARAA